MYQIHRSSHLAKNGITVLFGICTFRMPQTCLLMFVVVVVVVVVGDVDAYCVWAVEFFFSIIKMDRSRSSKNKKQRRKKKNVHQAIIQIHWKLPLTTLITSWLNALILI